MIVNCSLISYRADSIRKEELGKYCNQYFDYWAYLQCSKFPKPSVCESECTYTIITSSCDFNITRIDPSLALCNNFTITEI